MSAWLLALTHLIGAWEPQSEGRAARAEPAPDSAPAGASGRPDSAGHSGGKAMARRFPSEPMWTISSRFDRLIEVMARQHGLDPALVKAIVQSESAFDPYAFSVDGAQGLMQLMPVTGARYDVVDLLNPYLNLKAGMLHLKHLLEEFDGDPYLAVAAYNAGKYAVKRHGGIPPYWETRVYLYKVFGLQSLYAADFSASGSFAKLDENQPVKPVSVALK